MTLGLAFCFVPLSAVAADYLVAREQAQTVVPVRGAVQVNLTAQNLVVQTVTGRELRMTTEIWSDGKLSPSSMKELTPALRRLGKNVEISSPAQEQRQDFWQQVRAWFAGETLEGAKTHILVTLQVPLGERIDVHLAAGNFHYDNPTATNALQLHMAAGNAQIDASAQTMVLGAQAGNLLIVQHQGAQTRIQSAAGNIHWQGITRDLHIQDAAGNVHVHAGALLTGSRITVHAVSGNIEVCLPLMHVNGAVLATVGSSRNSYPGFVSDNTNADRATPKGVRVSLHSAVGNVTLRRCGQP
jgi:hypothetical protein